ncbi:MAG: sulfur transferase domain-containing protein [Acidobacteriota bacterium]
MRTRLIVAAAVLCVSSLLYAQKETIEGIRNFTKVDATVACAGSTEPAAMAEIGTRGYKAVINLREATETGALIEESTKAAEAAGLKYIHLPLNSSHPDEAVVGRYLAALKDPANQPTFIHCASGSRAGAMWLIKRMLVDGWSEDKATAEAVLIGLASPTLKQFALDYVSKHK